jgi:acetamidase/formamidase
MTANAYDAGGLANRPDPARVSWVIEKEKGVVRFDLRSGSRTDWGVRFNSPMFEMPLRPTLGFVAVAPPDRDAVASTVAGPFGGNMMSAGWGAGARVMLPVFQPGALLVLGHGHARQGDGTITGAASRRHSTSSSAWKSSRRRSGHTASVVRPSTVVGEFEMAWPRIETADSLMAVGTASSLLTALQHATLELHHWLDDDFGLSEKAGQHLPRPGDRVRNRQRRRPGSSPSWPGSASRICLA